MKEIYILWQRGAPDDPVIMAADDFERCNEQMAKYTAAEQYRMRVSRVDLIEDGDE